MYILPLISISVLPDRNECTEHARNMVLLKGLGTLKRKSKDLID
jgi:hypothetical protein